MNHYIHAIIAYILVTVEENRMYIICDRDYPPDPLDQKLGQATILFPHS